MSVQNGCSPRITDNSTITELDPVTMQQFTLSTGEADQDGRVIEKTGTSTPPTDEKIVITGDQDLTEREVTVIETSDEASKTPTPSPTVVTGKDTSGDQDGAVRDTVSETENLDTPTPSPTDVTDKDTSGDQGGTVRDTVSETEDLDTPTPSPTDATGKDTSGDQEGVVSTKSASPTPTPSETSSTGTSASSGTRTENVSLGETTGPEASQSQWPWLLFGGLGITAFALGLIYVFRKGKKEQTGETLSIIPLPRDNEREIDRSRSRTTSPRSLERKDSDSSGLPTPVLPVQQVERREKTKQLDLGSRGSDRGTSSGSRTPPPQRRNVSVSDSPTKPTYPGTDPRAKVKPVRRNLRPIPFILPDVDTEPSSSVVVPKEKEIDFPHLLGGVASVTKINVLSKIDQFDPVKTYVAISPQQQAEMLRSATDVFRIPPLSYVGAEISRKDANLASLKQLVHEFVNPSNNHEFDYLIIDATSELPGDESVVRALEKESVLKLFEDVMINDSLRMMKLSGFEKITVGELKTLKAKFPNVSCFDLEGVTLEGELDETFIDCLVRHSEKGNQAAQEERFKSGIAERAEAFRTGTHDAFNDLFGADPSQNPLGPMRLFVESLYFLKGLDISDGFVDKFLHPNLLKNFPNARLLDLSNCVQLSLESFKKLIVIRIESLILEGCSKIFQRDSQTLAQKHQVANFWVVDAKALETVAQCFYAIAPFIRFVNLYKAHEMDLMSSERVLEITEYRSSARERYLEIKNRRDQSEYIQYCTYDVFDRMTSILQKTSNKQDGYRLELVQVSFKDVEGSKDIKV
ncbi:hypothetical protein [Simkania sp.]|uniref:hypothetical protein n=1 Tax=Simkania sp. TaxID=34094 RepID=UPI003B52FC0B